MWLVTTSVELATFYRALIDDPLPCLARAYQIIDIQRAETRLLVEVHVSCRGIYCIVKERGGEGATCFEVRCTPVITTFLLNILPP